MKTIKTFLTITLVVAFAFSCKNEAKPEIKTIETASEPITKLDPNATYAKAEFTIDGMTCEIGCAKTIEKKMAKMEGVKMAKVDFDKRLAMVEYDEAKVSPESLEEAVTKVADIYKVKDMKVVEDFGKEAKTCKADCKKECCASKSEAEKKACSKDCKKACCSEEKKAE